MKRLLVITLFFLPHSIFAVSKIPCYPQWYVLFYYGKMTNDNLGEVIVGNYSLNNTSLYSLEVGKELSPRHPFRRFFQPILSSVDFRANITLLDDTYGHIYELNPYFTLNWNNFPWRQTIHTILSFGEGVSYVTKVPYAEEMNSDHSRRLLNFLLFDITFGLPRLPHWEISARIHHRSGAFGLYHANNSGSTAIGIALRYRFN